MTIPIQGEDSAPFTRPCEAPKNELLLTITVFLHAIGIHTKHTTISGDTFLPGVLIEAGSLLIDDKKLLYPGDLLHEAGHIAVTRKEDRSNINGNVGAGKDPGQAGGEEIMAIAWSYAAMVHLKLAPEIVFHPDGYKGASQWFIDQYTNGTYIGVPALQWIGLCYDEKQARIHQKMPYPYMYKWLRD